MNSADRPTPSAAARPVTVAAPSLDGYQPRTALGQRLLELRRQYLACGGELLDADGLDAAMRARRGGVDNV